MPIQTPVLSRSAHDRAAHLREDEDWLRQAWANPATRVMVISADARVSAPDGQALSFSSPAQVATEGIRLLLGEYEGVAYFAVLAREKVAAQGWANLRDLAVNLGPLDSGLLTAAVAMQAWHLAHTHCPRCGANTEPAQAGWVRVCVADGSQHFPRTDPAVIMLVDDGAGRCLLGRASSWPAGRFSTLAGFVEAGESAEAAVAREVGEEVGVAVTDIRYFASQPHPFPGSLMLGYTARLHGEPTLRIDGVEIADAGWFTRAEVRSAVDWDQTVDESLRLRALPPAMSIARQLIEHWLEAE